jgi:Cu2+-containing amine oxidase
MARRPTHPLDELTAEEVERAVSLIKDHPTFIHAEVRFCNMMLHQPPKEAVRSFEATGEPQVPL